MISGLYAITPDLLDTKKLVYKTRLAIEGGVRIVQYRNKLADRVLLNEQAWHMSQLCGEFDVPLIINDHLDIAVEFDVDGVHLGRDDSSLSQARQQLGRDKIIGVSCYNRLELALQAQASGADYVAFGAFFTSVTKPDTVKASIDLLCQARQETVLPIVCIGGINLRNARVLIENGCDAIAVSNALFCAKDIQATAEYFAKLFK